MAIDQTEFQRVLADVLTAHGVDPSGTGSVPFELMPSISREVSDGLGIANDDDLHQLLDLLLPEILDRSMTEEGQRVAIRELAKGLGLQISRPS